MNDHLSLRHLIAHHIRAHSKHLPNDDAKTTVRVQRRPTYLHATNNFRATWWSSDSMASAIVNVMIRTILPASPIHLIPLPFSHPSSTHPPKSCFPPSSSSSYPPSPWPKTLFQTPKPTLPPTPPPPSTPKSRLPLHPPCPRLAVSKRKYASKRSRPPTPLPSPEPCRGLLSRMRVVSATLMIVGLWFFRM